MKNKKVLLDHIYRTGEFGLRIFCSIFFFFFIPGRFANLNTLNTLRLCGNNLTRPPKEALGSLQSLQKLYLNNNRLTALNKNAFGNLPVVSLLELENNRIFNVSYAAFENLRQLTEINLSRNNLSWVPPGAFLGIYYVYLLIYQYVIITELLQKIIHNQNSVSK